MSVLCLALGALNPGATQATGGISSFDEHCLNPSNKLGAWDFIPAENIESISTTEHPGLWNPGIRNDPASQGHHYLNDNTNNSVIDVKFDPETPESVLWAKPLFILQQIIDASRVRVGFKSKPNDPWQLSKICDVKSTLGKAIGKLEMGVLSSSVGEHWGGPPGSTAYQKFMVDFVHYRYDLSTEGNLPRSLE